MRNSSKILFIIFLICLIPTVYVYISHGHEELETASKTVGHKHIKTLAEGLFFIIIAIGYIFFTALILYNPKSRIPYIVLIVGTIVIIILYFVRIFGIPIPFTDVTIRDLSTDWRDVATKIPQAIMLPVLTLLAVRR